MAEKKQTDNDISKIDNKWELVAFLFKYRSKELLLFMLIIAIILNVTDINLKEIIVGFFK